MAVFRQGDETNSGRLRHQLASAKRLARCLFPYLLLGALYAYVIRSTGSHASTSLVLWSSLLFQGLMHYLVSKEDRQEHRNQLNKSWTDFVESDPLGGSSRTNEAVARLLNSMPESAVASLRTPELEALADAIHDGAPPVQFAALSLLAKVGSSAQLQSVNLLILKLRQAIHRPGTSAERKAALGELQRAAEETSAAIRSRMPYEVDRVTLLRSAQDSDLLMPAAPPQTDPGLLVRPAPHETDLDLLSSLGQESEAHVAARA